MVILTALVTKEYLFQHGSSFWKQRTTFTFSFKISNSEYVWVQDVSAVREVWCFFYISTPPSSQVLRTSKEENIIKEGKNQSWWDTGLLVKTASLFSKLWSSLCFKNSSVFGLEGTLVSVSIFHIILTGGTLTILRNPRLHYLVTLNVGKFYAQPNPT